MPWSSDLQSHLKELRRSREEFRIPQASSLGEESTGFRRATSDDLLQETGRRGSVAGLGGKRHHRT